MIVLTLLRGKRTSFDRSGELAATVVGVLVADSSDTLGFVLPSAMAKEVTVSLVEVNQAIKAWSLVSWRPRWWVRW